MNRAETFNLFLSHTTALHIAIDRVYSQFAMQITIGQDETHRAVVLARSSDYWQQRIHLHRVRPSLVICFTHDTCLPCRVLALDEGYLFEIGQLPKWYTPEKRATERGCRVLLGQLLSGSEAGFQHLEKLPRSTRYRYLALMRRYMQNRAGRPLKV